MSQIHEYNVVIPEAARLASLMGAKADLERVLAYVERMIERWSGPHLAKSPFDIVGFTTPVDFDEWEALSTATAVAYARCFMSGVREELPEDDVKLGTSEIIATHAFLMAFRNKHVAHSVNPFEQNTVGVQIADTFASASEIESVTPRHTRQNGFSFDEPPRVRNLAKWWLERVSADISRETIRVRDILRKMSLDEVKLAGELPSHAVDQKRDVRIRRRTL
jgi:hypothetical protein